MKKLLLALSYTLMLFGSATIIAMNQEQQGNDWTTDSTVTVHHEAGSQNKNKCFLPIKLKVVDQRGHFPDNTPHVLLYLPDTPYKISRKGRYKLIVDSARFQFLFDTMELAGQYFSQKDFDEAVENKVQIKLQAAHTALKAKHKAVKRDMKRAFKAGHQVAKQGIKNDESFIQRHRVLSLGTAALFGAVVYKSAELAFTWWQQTRSN